MVKQVPSFISAISAAVLVCVLTTGCAKDESVADAAPANMKAGVPATLPTNAPPVVGKQIKASQDAAQAMRSQAEKNGADYNAARAKAQ